MEKFFAFTPLSASFKRTVSMVLWSLSILVVLSVIGYFISQVRTPVLKNVRCNNETLTASFLFGGLCQRASQC